MFRKTVLGLTMTLILASLSFGHAVGETAPDFSATDKNGKKHSISDYKGKVVLLKFWARWCGPCKRTLPKSKKLQKKYGSRGFMIFSVGLSKNRRNDMAYLRSNGYKFPVMAYKDGWKTAPYKVKGIPYEVLIGRDGKILYQGHWGPKESVIKKALDAGGDDNKKDNNADNSAAVKDGMGSLSITPLSGTPKYFSVTGIDGKTYSLNNLKGKVVFLNFWATWCPPCRREMPDMQKLHNAMKGKDFVMIAVSMERTAKVRRFMKKNGYTFPVAAGSRSAMKKYGVRGIPATFIINKQGKLVGKAVGSRNWASSASIKMFKALAAGGGNSDGGGNDGNGGGGSNPEDIKNGFSSLRIRKLSGSKASWFSVRTLKGRRVSLGSLKGKVIFLNFWATWCPPCRREMPDMQKLHKAMKGKKFIMLAVSPEASSKVRSFMKRNRYTFPAASGARSALRTYKVRGIPSTFIIDKKGRLLGKAVGGRKWDSAASIAMFKALADQ